MSIKKNIIKLFNFLPVYKSKIFINNFNGNGYGCNPKYIAEELLKNKSLDIVWLCKSKKEASTLPKEITPVYLGTLKSFYELATSKVLVSNVRLYHLFQNNLNKKQSQFYMQTWHAMLGFKKVEKGAKKLSIDYISMARKDSKIIDVFISGCRENTREYKEDFFYEGVIKEIGCPRNDILFKMDERKIVEIKRNLCIPEGKKIITYIPTFRDGEKEVFEKLNADLLTESLRKRFKGEWIILTRYHPNDINKNRINGCFSNVMDVTDYPDVQEILMVSDVLVTDYSSVALDFSLLLRPVFLYIPDYSIYKEERGFVIDPKDGLFCNAESNEELSNVICNYDNVLYKEKIMACFKKNGIVKNYNASASCAQIIMNKIRK